MTERYKQYFTIGEFMEDFPMSRSSVYRLNAFGLLPFTKFGRSTRIAACDIAAWAATLTKVQGKASNDNM